MPKQDTSSSRENASFSRRGLLTAGIASAAVVALPAHAADAAVTAGADEIDWLLDQEKEFRLAWYKLSAEVEPLLKHPDRPPHPTIRMNELDALRYADGFSRSECHSIEQVRHWFRKYLACLFAPAGVRDAIQKDEARAVEIIRARMAAREEWDYRTGLTALCEQEDLAEARWLAKMREVELFPCQNFATVARKIAFIREMLGGDTITGRYATEIILSMDGQGTPATEGFSGISA